MGRPQQIRKKFRSIVLDMEKDAAPYVETPGVDFTRNRKLSFSETLLFMITSGAGTIRSELLYHFNYGTTTPTASAFVQRRSRIKLTAFIHVLNELNQSFVPSQLFNDKYQLIACDGTGFDIAHNERDLDTYHPPKPRDMHGYNALQSVALYDVLEKRFLDAIVQGKRKSNEYMALCKLVDRFKPAGIGLALFLADRGFASYNVFSHMIRRERYFLIRASDMTTRKMLGVKSLGNADQDRDIERILTRSHSKKLRDPKKDAAGMYRTIPSQTPCGCLDNTSSKTFTIKLRVARFQLPGGNWENVITNLDREEFNLEGLRDLYGLRWGIELAFRDYKNTLGTGKFSSGKFSFIEQELWARMILYNVCSIIARYVATCHDSKRKYVYKIDFTLAIKICRYYLRLKEGRSPPDVEKLIASNLQPVRPGRKFTRQKKVSIPASFGYRFV